MLRRCKRAYRAVAAVLCLSNGLAFAASEPPGLTSLPKYQAPVPYAGIRNWHVTQNLGPTGARGWVYGHTSDSRESREILVKSVEPGSPAAGVLRPYDVIVGTDARFDSDARLALAQAITVAESRAGRGALQLLRWRDGETQQVTVTLPVMGDYSPTAPFDCPKVDAIVENAGQFLAARMPVQGFSGLQGSLNALLLFATGEDRYLDHVRRSACRMGPNHTVTDAGHETWRWGYMNTFLCEYYLATGDKRVLPTIQKFCDVLAAGQCNPGTWGHRGVPDFIPPGYGSMNQSGLVCFISLVLARQCGVNVDEGALRNCVRFYGGYAGRGGIPYGDHAPAAGASCNGKNGSAAVAFNLLGADRASQWFGRLCGSSDLAAFEGGHTGNFFNQTWTPLGASLTGTKNYRAFWSRFNSYRDLARRWDGSFVTQPLPNTREGDLGTGNYVSKGPMWTTGGYALSYLALNNRLGILGRRESVFGKGAPADLEGPLALYDGQKFAACIAAVDKLPLSAARGYAAMAAQLKTAAQRNLNSIDLTLADMQETLASGDLLKLKCQLQGMESIVDADDARLASFRAAVEDPNNAGVLKTGEAYHRIVSSFGRCGMKGFEVYLPGAASNSRWQGELRGIAERGEGAYREMARTYLAALPKLLLVPNAKLTPAPDGDAKASAGWRMFGLADGNPSGLKELDEAAEDWEPVELPFVAGAGSKVAAKECLFYCAFEVADPGAVQALALRYTLRGKMRVLLNGELVMDVAGATGRGGIEGATIKLKPCTLELLKQGANSLVVEALPVDDHLKIDLGLEAMTSI